MASAVDIVGAVFKEGSVTLLARVIGADGSAIQTIDISAAEYTLYELDENDPDSRTAIAGHTGVSIDPDDLLFDELQTDTIWGDKDATGYNFRHIVDISTVAFAKAGVTYLMVFTLTPVLGQPILVRFRLPAN